MKSSIKSSAKGSAIHIRIYGKSKGTYETYNLFSDAISKLLKKLKKKNPVALEIDRNMADLIGQYQEPVIEVNGQIISEGTIPCCDTVSKMVGQLATMGA